MRQIRRWIAGETRLYVACAKHLVGLGARPQRDWRGRFLPGNSIRKGMKIERYGRYWAVYGANGTLVCVTVYKKGAKAVVDAVTTLTKLAIANYTTAA